MRIVPTQRARTHCAPHIAHAVSFWVTMTHGSWVHVEPVLFREDVDRTIVISDISSSRRHRVLPTFSTSPAGVLDDSVLIEFALKSS